MPNILVTGSNGQVGLELQALAKEYSYNFYFADKNTLDITQKELIERALDFYFDHTDSITAQKISDDVASGKEKVHNADDVFSELGLE